MHLRTDTIDLCACLFPLADPVDQRFELVVVVPGRLEVVVVDEELEVGRVGALDGSVSAACSLLGGNHVIDIAEVVLPEEVVGRAFGSMLQVVEAVDVATARNGLVDQIPSLHLAGCSIHHAADPKVHGVGERVVLLFVGLRASASG